MMVKIIVIIFLSFSLLVLGDESCLTPNGLDGSCVLFKTCSSLYSIYLSGQMSNEDRQLIKESKCYARDGKYFVCCPTTTTTTSTAEKTTTITDQSLTNQNCVDPNGASGRCIKFKDCPKLFGIFNKKLVSMDNRNLIRKAQCGFDKEPYVCCAEVDPTESSTTTMRKTSNRSETTSFIPEWLTKLKILLPSAPECGTDGMSDRIFGGKVTKVDEFPWTALIGYKKQDNTIGYYCSGSLINKRYVLTAAQCTKKIDRTWKVDRVKLGEWDTSTDEDCDEDGNCADPVLQNKVVDVIEYKDYRKSDQSQHFDIALLRLARPIEKFTDFIRPICLPLDPSLWDIDFNGYTFSSAGWGKTENGENSVKKLRIDTLPHVSHMNCSSAYSRTSRNIVDSQICAGGLEGIDTCKGDLGGPLMAESVDGDLPYWFLVGITSYGFQNCGTKEIPGVYTRVSFFLEWIAEKMRN